MIFKELPKKEHDKLVRSYWKTWLAAFKFKVKDNAAFERFVHEMEGLLLEHCLAGDMGRVKGVSGPNE